MRFNFRIWFRFSISCEKTFTPQLYRLHAAVAPADRKTTVCARGGDSHLKVTGMLVGKLELTP